MLHRVGGGSGSEWDLPEERLGEALELVARSGVAVLDSERALDELTGGAWRSTS